MPSWKLPSIAGFAVLMDFIKQNKKTSGAAASGVSSLQEDLLGLSERTTQTFAQVNSAMAVIDSKKQDKGVAVPITIPKQGWTQDDSFQNFPFRFELAVKGITSKDRADINIAPAGQGTAYSCGLCHSSETQEGKIIIWAATVPEEEIRAEVWLHQGKE